MTYAPSLISPSRFIRRALRQLASPLLALCFLPALHAHDPYQAWSSAIVRDDHLELTVTMADSTAFRLMDPEKGMEPPTRNHSAAHHPRLVKAAGKLCVLTAGKEALKPSKIDVQFTDEDDVTFKLIYPRPPAGKLHLHSVYLEKLGDGYGSILEVADTSGNHLGWDQLTAAYSSLEVTVHPKAATKKN